MKCLIRFAQKHEGFQIPELQALAQLFCIKIQVTSFDYAHPFLKVDLSADDARLLLSRSVCIMEIIELLAEGPDEASLHQSHQECTPLSYYDEYRHSTFAFSIDAFGAKLSASEKVSLINGFAYTKLEGAICISNPQVRFTIISDNKRYFYYGRHLGYGQRDLINKLSLKNRAYLGTTSMDAELSLLMANLAKATRGSLIYDPFVGTGSCLIAAAIFGALCYGSDIDGRQMRGQPADGERGKQLRRYPGDKNTSHNSVRESARSMKEIPEKKLCSVEVVSIQSNLQQYGVKCRFIDGLVFDIRQHPWRHTAPLFSAICCDPPYGVRAGAKKIGAKKPVSLTSEQRINRYPQTLPYEMDELVTDLFAFGAAFLLPGCRLVFWYAVEREEEGHPPFDEANLPHDTRYHREAAILQPCRDFKRWLMVFSLLAA